MLFVLLYKNVSEFFNEIFIYFILFMNQNIAMIMFIPGSYFFSYFLVIYRKIKLEYLTKFQYKKTLLPLSLSISFSKWD